MKLTFDLPAPKPSHLVKKDRLWSTYYYAHAAKEVSSGGVPLWNASNKPLGPSLSQRDWCLAAMEGTVAVKRKDGSVKTYNYSGKGEPAQTSCKAVFPHLKPAVLAGTERVRWKVSNGPYGDGAASYVLVPFRTWAVDRQRIPLGTVLYVREARGVEIVLPNGSKKTHDGYFFAADVGGAIKGNHVDSFLGITSSNPFPFVKSAPQHTFDAHVVQNKSVQDFLVQEHHA
ncbi:MAG: 3D domain-containing protein [Prosthecobacter sp.]|nr:3D domain-containing protein [Prosthecobacter sp.]